jgi:phage terminase large subunit-like protein
MSSSSLPRVPPTQLTAWLTAVPAELERREKRAIDRYFPDVGPYRRELYAKHLQFFAAGGQHVPMPSCPDNCDGSPHRERCFMAANRIGKTSAGVYETVLHLTGAYPHWWTGKRFPHAIKAWAASDTNKQVRGVLQEKLIGPVNKQGTGLIPADAITHRTTKAGIAEAVDTIYVKHASGGTSSVQLKSYQEGRESFQADTVHWLLFDEEPSLAIYSEGLIRTMTCDGQVVLVFTPLLGLSEVVLSFVPNGLPGAT